MPGEVVVLLHDLHGLVDAVCSPSMSAACRWRWVRTRSDISRTRTFHQRAKERFDLSGNVNGTSHPIGRFSCYRKPGGRWDSSCLCVAASVTIWEN